MKAIAAGYSHLLALTSQGKVIAWGTDIFGETEVPEAAQSGVVGVSAGMLVSIAVTAEGKAVSWGYGESSSDNVPEGARSGVVAVAAGEQHLLALRRTDAPSRPTISFVEAGRGVARLSFSPGALGSRSTTAYVVRAIPVDGGPVVSTRAAAGSPTTVTGLTGGRTYWFTVTATNSAGSATSDRSNPVTIEGER